MEPEINFKLSKQAYREQTFFGIINEEKKKKTLAKYGFCYSGKLKNKIHCYACLKEYNEDDDDSIEENLHHEKWCTFKKYKNSLCPKIVEPYTGLYFEKERLATFVEWPLFYTRPEDLARNGFYYLRVKDYCACISCNVVIHDWEIDDDIAETHNLATYKLKLHCNFSKEEKAPQEEKRKEEIVVTTKKKEYTNTITNNDVVEKYMNDTKDRLDSFFCRRHPWPKERISQTPEQFVSAGFYYLCTATDAVICGICHLRLGNWEHDDDPWFLHVKWRPDCPFVQTMLMSDKRRTLEEMIKDDDDDSSDDDDSLKEVYLSFDCKPDDEMTKSKIKDAALLTVTKNV